MRHPPHPGGDPPVPGHDIRGEPDREEFSLELYRSLRAEAAGYIERIPGLWWQKFILVGGTVAFVFMEDVKLDRLSSGYSTWAVIAAICLLPVLAVLVDARTLEYGLHARVISIFVAQHFRDPQVLALWEHTMWSSRGIFSLVALRSAISVLVTIVPTMGITVIAGMLVGSLVGNLRLWMGIGLALCTIYLLSTIAVTLLIWRRHPSVPQP